MSVAHASACRVDTPVDACRPVKKCRDESRHGTQECVRHSPERLVVLYMATGPGRTLPGEMDDISRSGTDPSTLPAPRRAFRPPPSCIPSKWDENGRPRAAWARSIAYKYAKWPASVPAFFNHLLKRALDFRDRRIKRRTPRVEDNVPLGPELGPMHAKRFTQPAFDPVSQDRAADGARNGEPQTCAVPMGFSSQTKRREDRARNANAIVIDCPEVSRPQNPRRARKRELRLRQRKSGRRVHR